MVASTTIITTVKHHSKDIFHLMLWNLSKLKLELHSYRNPSLSSCAISSWLTRSTSFSLLTRNSKNIRKYSLFLSKSISGPKDKSLGVNLPSPPEDPLVQEVLRHPTDRTHSHQNVSVAYGEDYCPLLGSHGFSCSMYVTGVG